MLLAYLVSRQLEALSRETNRHRRRREPSARSSVGCPRDTESLLLETTHHAPG
jgi:hypothetical protein